MSDTTTGCQTHRQLVCQGHQGRNHVFNVGGPITTLAQKKLDRSTQFGAVDYIITLYSSTSYVKSWGSVQILGVRTPRLPQWLRPWRRVMWLHDTVELTTTQHDIYIFIICMNINVWRWCMYVYNMIAMSTWSLAVNQCPWMTLEQLISWDAIVSNIC